MLSFFYILASVLLLGFGTTGLNPRADFVLITVGGFVFLSFLIGWLPLKLGFRELRNFEF